MSIFTSNKESMSYVKLRNKKSKDGLRGLMRIRKK